MPLVVEHNRIRLDGDLTVATVGRLCAQLPTLEARYDTLDMAAVGEVDSAGLALVVYWQQQRAGRGERLTLLQPPAQFHRLAALYRLQDLVA